MRATDFEYRHQTLLHLLTVGLAFLTYVVSPDDIEWALVKPHATYQALLGRLVFGMGALMIVSAALVETWASAYRQVRQIRQRCAPIPIMVRAGTYNTRFISGESCLRLDWGSLHRRWGAVILLAGEMVLIVRLLAREHHAASFRQYRWQSLRFLTLFHRWPSGGGTGADWGKALRQQAGQWGLAMTMIVFTLTLQDRVAEIMADAGFLAWIVLNIPDFAGSSGSRGRA
jgi:hypothetical protein